jgi:hypothetical protein
MPKIPITARLAGPSWGVYFFQRHQDDDPSMVAPGAEFLDGCPKKVAATFYAVLEAVAAAPPPSFSGGGKWEAMRGSMSGYYEARVDGPARRHYRLFCVLERNGLAIGLGGPSIVAITGMSKPFRTTFGERDYAKVRELGAEYRGRKPRSVR